MNVYVSDDVLTKLIRWGLEPKQWIRDAVEAAVKAEEAKRV